MSEPGFVPHIAFGLDPMLASTAILVVTYAIIIWDRLNRAIVALVGGSLAVLVGALDQTEAIKSIDWNTIGILAGMMIITSIAQRSGIFQYLAVWAAQRARANPAGILVLLQCVTALVSAFLNNVTTVLLIAPVTLAITTQLKVRSYPFLFAEVFAANIGGTATLIGDPPNIMIGSLAGLNFNAFLANLLPIILVVQAVQALMIHLLWGRDMRSTPDARARIMALNAKAEILDATLLWQSAVVLVVAVVGFVFADQLRLEPATIAIGAAALLMLLDNWEHHSQKQTDNVTRTLTEIEWITIVFFIGLFVVVHAVEVSGLIRLIANGLVTATGGDLARAGYAILWGSAMLSAIIDNIPFVAAMIPLIKDMAPAFGGPDKVEALWWCLSLGACLGGNGTLVGAAANLTVAGLAERSGVPFRFVPFLLYGFPMMVVSIVICHIYVWLRYF